MGRRNWEGMGLLLDPSRHPDSPLTISIHHTDLPSNQATLMVGQLWRVPICYWYPYVNKSSRSRLKIIDREIILQGKASSRGLELVRTSAITSCEATVKRVTRSAINNSVEVSAEGIIDGIQLSLLQYEGPRTEFGRLEPGSAVQVKSVRMEEECLAGPTYVLPKSGKELLGKDKSIVLKRVKAGAMFPVEFRSI